MASSRKHTQEATARFANTSKSNVHYFLKNNSKIAKYTLDKLSKKQARQFSKLNKKLGDGSLPWNVAILIDATIQKRSSRHPENAQFFNHGKGYVVGHQWTNIVILIGDNVIPLPPFPFYTKKYCRENNIKYQTESERIVEYLNNLDLEEYIGFHSPERVIVLGDSGYDNKKLENAILNKNWNFIISLINKRGFKTIKAFNTTPKSQDWKWVSTTFKNHRKIGWDTIKVPKNSSQKKWMEFRTRQITGHLKSVSELVQLICSEFKNSKKGKRKHLACSDLKATTRQILIAYRLRWEIEIFHKEVKMFLGFEDISATNFSSVVSHVHWVYCAYILLNSIPSGIPPDKTNSVAEKQLLIDRAIKNQSLSDLNHLLTKINGVQRLKKNLKMALTGSDTSDCPFIRRLIAV